MNFLPKTTIVGGFILMGCSIAKWYFYTLDYSQLLFGTLFGITFVLFGKFYDIVMKQEGRIQETDKGLSTAINYFRDIETKLEKHNIKP